jgi:putative transposase
MLTVERMCHLTGVSRAGYYRNWAEVAPDEAELEIRGRIQVIVLEHRRRYGILRVTATLHRRGMIINHKVVERIMREDNLLAIRYRKYILTTDSRHECQVYVNLAPRMTLTGINQLWVADITYIRLRTEFVYLAVVIDRFSRKVIGWSLDRNAGCPHSGSGTAAGHCPASAAAGGGHSLRSGRPVRLRRLQRSRADQPDDSQHEPSGKPLR